MPRLSSCDIGERIRATSRLTMLVNNVLADGNLRDEEAWQVYPRFIDVNDVETQPHHLTNPDKITGYSIGCVTCSNSCSVTLYDDSGLYEIELPEQCPIKQAMSGNDLIILE